MNAQKKSEKKSGNSKKWISFLDKPKANVPPDIKVARSEVAGNVKTRDAADTTSVTVKYSLSGVWEGTVKEFQRIEIPETTLTEKEGAPAIPKNGIFVAVPDETEEVTVRVIDKSTFTVDHKVNLAPAPKQFVEEEFKEVYKPDLEIFSSDNPYPGKDFDFLGLKTISGVKVAHIFVYLGQYRPVSGVMELVKSMTLEVSYRTPPPADRGLEKKFRKMPESNLILGLELLGDQSGFYTKDEYYDLLRQEKDKTSERDVSPADAFKLKVPGKISEYVIITPPALETAVDPLLKAKQGWPHYGSVALTTDVQAEFPAADLKESIRAFIVWAWANWSCPPRFVVLAGDTDVIPMHYYGIYASDHYYTDTGSSLAPELSVARIPTSNAVQLKEACQHLAKYGSLRSGDWGGWQNKVMLCAYQSSTYETTCDQVYDKIKSRFTTIKRYAKDTTKNDVMTTMNNGVLLAMYRGHGGEQEWSSGNGLKNADVATLDNASHPPFVLNICCQNGHVDDNSLETITEAFIRRKKSVAVFASSRNSWTFPNNDFTQYLFDAIMSGGCQTPAAIIQYAKTKMVLNHSTSSYHMDNVKMYNLFGDPTAYVGSNPEWLRGNWSMDHDGWKGTLKVTRIWNFQVVSYDGKSAPVWSISGQYVSGDNKISPFTGTLGGFDKNHLTLKSGRSDHKVEFVIVFSAVNKQKFVGYVHTWTLSQLSGLTWWNNTPFGWTARKI